MSINFRNISKTIITSLSHHLRALTLAVAPFCALALAAAPFAPSSRLASGRWVRVRVSETGMHIVTDAQLKAQGLDPARTKVYGYGGRIVPEDFPEGLPDDLPLQPSIRTSGGIVFYATDNVIWDRESNHTLNPYCDESYYFLCDSAVEEEFVMPEAKVIADADGLPLTTFSECLLHEQDLYGPSHTGRTLLGEDFRAQSSRTFSFQLPGNTGDPVTARVRFGARTTNGRSKLSFTANGNPVHESYNDEIKGVGNTETFMEAVTPVKTIPDVGDRLTLGVNYSGTGAVSLARLDWIEIVYTRELRLTGSDLHFTITATPGCPVRVEGCSADTRIWDVTRPDAPAEVKFSLDGSAATFAPTEYGYREYVAFNPAKVNRAVVPAGKVGNQNIHALPVPDMVIISPSEYLRASERLAEMHRTVDGMTVHVLTSEAIYNEFSSGSRDVGAFRKMLKMWHERALEEPDGPAPRYCLIMSKPTYDNKMTTSVVKSAGYPRVPIWQEPTHTNTSQSYSTDDFIGMLDYDSGDLTKARIHVAVGRIPATSVAEAEQAVDKIIKYVTQPDYGSWRNRVMIIADDGDNNAHMTQADKVYTALTGTGNGMSFVYDKLYFDAYRIVPTAAGDTYPEAKARLLNQWNEGVGFINYIGHANPVSWSHEKVLLWEDITSFSNERLPILFAATCEFARWDADTQSGGEVMMLNPNGGFVSGVIPSRSVYIAKNGILNERTMKEMFRREADGKARRLGDIMVAGKNEISNDDNKLRYSLVGDPALRIINPPLNVVTETIGDLPADGEPQTIGARATVKVAGYITDPAGNLIDDFNGIIEVSLFDAEKPIITNGHGKTGSPHEFNDRSTRLTVESTVVTNGRWETTLHLPGEIENNHTPPMLSYYAYSDSGLEANGMCENFYVEGYDDTAEEDNEGPRIESFTINHDDFAAGDVTHSTPLVMASFSDESGINVSDASLGHDITLRLDGKQVFNDVSSCFVPDPYRDGAGSIIYALSDIEPGTHDLELKVWDNAGNSSTATILFNVALRKSAGIRGITALPLPGTTRLTVELDRPAVGTTTLFEIYTLSGRRVWHTEAKGSGRTSNQCSVSWDHTDDAGRDIGRDIYIFRATVTTDDGCESRASTKLAVGPR